MPRTTVLLGRDHAEPGAITSDACAGGRLGFAISAGATDKPNEDAIAVREGEPLVAAVADGHWGAEASELAARQVAVLDLTGDDVPAALRRAIQALNDQLTSDYDVRRETAERPADLLPPETTLVLCLFPAGGGTMHWASFGDSYLFTRTAAGLLRHNESRRAWLGARIQGKVDRVLELGTVELAPGDSVALASDGLMEPVIDGPLLATDQLGGTLASDLPAEGKARALASAALAMGGHDNIAVIVHDV